MARTPGAGCAEGPKRGERAKLTYHRPSSAPLGASSPRVRPAPKGASAGPPLPRPRPEPRSAHALTLCRPTPDDPPGLGRSCPPAHGPPAPSPGPTCSRARAALTSAPSSALDSSAASPAQRSPRCRRRSPEAEVVAAVSEGRGVGLSCGDLGADGPQHGRRRRRVRRSREETRPGE